MSRIPDNPVEFVKECVKAGHVFWTYHANMRLDLRKISRRKVLEAVDSYEIVESYPDDKYLPSYLLVVEYGGIKYHALFAVDVDNHNVRVVTAYCPDNILWSDDFKRRK